jgi:hypothetical protein
VFSRFFKHEQKIIVCDILFCTTANFTQFCAFFQQICTPQDVVFSKTGPAALKHEKMTSSGWYSLP